MRVRAIAALVIVLVIVGGTIAIAALWNGGPASGRTGLLTVDVSDVRAGSVKAVATSSSVKHHQHARVFLARTDADHVSAFLGFSTHLGCRLLLPGDPGYGQGFTQSSRRYLFEDPCGGSVYALNGDCTGGPCPRGLDRFAVTVHDDVAEVDLQHFMAGPPRGT
jgi:Rieske Fe-S protein